MTGPDHSRTITSSSVEFSSQIGERIGAAAQPGQVIALRGPLGAGKTHLVKGIARGMGIVQMVTSPTFVLVNEYNSERRRLIHIDTYRLGPGMSSTTPSIALDATTIGLEDILADAEPEIDGGSGAIVAIEWAERIIDFLPADHLQITLHLVPDQPQRRRIELSAHGVRSLALLRSLTSTVRPTVPS